MEIVSTALHCCRNNSPCRPPKFRTVVVGLHFEFLHGVYTGRVVNAVSTNGIGVHRGIVIDAIKHHIIG